MNKNGLEFQTFPLGDGAAVKCGSSITSPSKGKLKQVPWTSESKNGCA